MIKKRRRILSAALILVLFLGTALPSAAAAEDTVNVLLIGLDGRPGLSGCRSDTMVLCSYRPENSTLTLVSFLRDLYLPIPGHGRNRLNAAYAFGGRELLLKTLEENFGLEIDGCVEVNFDQFSAIIDSLGGVQILLREDEARRINQYCPGSTLSSGTQLLSGEEALCFSRIRDLDPDGDFSRTRRQQVVLRAILARWKDAPITSMAAAVGDLLPMVSTDLSPVQIMDWVFTAAPARNNLNVQSLQIPRQETCRDENIQGMAVIVCDIVENRTYLEGQLGLR